MTPADPGEDAPADRVPERRRLSPPPPRYEASDEISLDDPADEPVPVRDAAPRPRLRDSGAEPSLLPAGESARVGRPVLSLLLWVAPSSSALGFVIGAALFSFGMSVRQAATATAVGAVVAGLLLVSGVLIGRRAGLPAEVAAREVFGSLGARAAAILLLISRVVWGSLALWISAGVVGGLVGSPGSIPVLLAVGAIVVGVVAAIGYRAVVWSHAVVSVVGTVLLIGLIAVTADRVDVPVAIGIGDGPDPLVLGGIVIVLSVVALIALPGATAIGRYQGRAGTTMIAVWSIIGAGAPIAAAIVWGALLAASNPVEARSLASSPVEGLLALTPVWAALPLAAAAALGLLTAAALAVYSGGFTVQAAGLAVGRAPAAVLVAVAVGGAAVPMALASLDVGVVLRDVVPTLAVPVVAFSASIASRLLSGHRTAAGDPPSVRWYPSAVLAAAIVLGYGLMSGDPSWLAWQGYLFPDASWRGGAIAESDPGVLIALLVGALAGASPSRSRRPRTREASHRVTSDPVPPDH